MSRPLPAANVSPAGCFDTTGASNNRYSRTDLGARSGSLSPAERKPLSTRGLPFIVHQKAHEARPHTRKSPLAGPSVAIPLCVVANYVVALTIVSSKWGSVFIMDDDFHNSSIAVPVIAGLVLGFVLTMAFGPRIAAMAGAIGLAGVTTVLLTFTLLTVAAAGAVGCFVGWVFTRTWVRDRPSD